MVLIAVQENMYIYTQCLDDSKSCGTFNERTVSVVDVMSAIRSLRAVKNDGVDPFC